MPKEHVSGVSKQGHVGHELMTQSSPLLIQGGRIVDPAQDLDIIGDLLINHGVISFVGGKIDSGLTAQATIIDARELVVCPGFIDLHCHLREPGFEYKETVATGTRAAAAGGFTTICAMPNTSPVMDSRSIVEFVQRKAKEEGAVRVLPIGAVTKGSNGNELADMGELAEAGVIGFSDDGHPVADPHIMRQALSYSSGLGLPIINHCEVLELTRGGVMAEGWISNRLGLKGIPNSAEDIMVGRDIELAALTGGRLHIAHASTSGTLELVRKAKKRGVNISCEVTPHHLTMADETVMGYQKTSSVFEPLSGSAYETNAKVSPPLRSQTDVRAMVQGLKDGSIDFIATDHAPHGTIEKQCTFNEAANGISSLETALSTLLGLTHSGEVPLPLIIEKLTAAPAKFLGINRGSIKPGAPADVAVLDPNKEWVVTPNSFRSKGKNTPLAGATLKGRVVKTIVAGEVVYEELGAEEGD